MRKGTPMTKPRSPMIRKQEMRNRGLLRSEKGKEEEG
jgi:hypothetical protein